MVDVLTPIGVFNGLHLSGEIKELWPDQKEVLTIYSDSLKDKKRIAIELPTGSGKSIIGLLILEMWRRSGKRVAILTSSNALSEIMLRRCNDLGIQGAMIAGKWRTDTAQRERLKNIKMYKRCQAIGIINYWAYMQATDIPKPNILIIDDADFFENWLIDQYSVVISKEHDADIWNQIFNSLNKYPVYKKLLPLGLGKTFENVQLVYFPHAFKLIEEIREVISSRSQDQISGNLYWSFKYNSDRMRTYLMFVFGNDIIITPYIILGSDNERLQDIDQIIFMSATLGTPKRIHRIMGSYEPIHILSEKDLKSKIGTMGKRIIFPMDISISGRSLGNDIKNATADIVQRFGKVLILCNSLQDANDLKDFLEQLGVECIVYKSEEDSIAFSNRKNGVLLVAGRFIGLDFPGEACRVEIIPRMPYILSPIDVLVKNILEDTDYANEKVSHRLVQAFGRCNRNPQDYAIYFMLDSRMASDIRGEEKIFKHFPSRMKAELDFGQGFVEENGLEGAIKIGDDFLKGKVPEFEKEITELEPKNAISQPSLDEPYRLEIKAWFDLIERQNFVDAARKFEECINYYSKLQDPGPAIQRQIAWLHYLVANSYYLAGIFFRDERFKPNVVEHLRRSVENGYTSWFSGLQLIINELEQLPAEDENLIFDVQMHSFKEHLLRIWADFQKENQRKKTPISIWEEFRTNLMEKSHGIVCDNLERAFELMGFEVKNLSKEVGKPDLLLFSNLKTNYICLVEIKTKEKGDELGTDAVDQIGGHKESYQLQYPDYHIFPLVFTNKAKVSPTAEEKARNNVRIMKAMEFVTFMNDYFDIMKKSWAITNPTERLKFAEKVPTTEDFRSVFRQRSDPIVNIADLDVVIKKSA
jgi:hypothetical protein